MVNKATRAFNYLHHSFQFRNRSLYKQHGGSFFLRCLCQFRKRWSWCKPSILVHLLSYNTGHNFKQQVLWLLELICSQINSQNRPFS